MDALNALYVYFTYKYFNSTSIPFHGQKDIDIMSKLQIKQP